MKTGKRGQDIESKDRDEALAPITEIKEITLFFPDYPRGEIEKSLGKFEDKCYPGENPWSEKN